MPRKFAQRQRLATIPPCWAALRKPRPASAALIFVRSTLHLVKHQIRERVACIAALLCGIALRGVPFYYLAHHVC